MTLYDVIVIGAGHNGLVAAAYLARAGKSVLVLEQAPSIGGTVATDVLTPGFRAPACFPTLESFHPSITRDLQLATHGLRLVASRRPVWVPDGNGTGLSVRKLNGRYELSSNDTDRAALSVLDAFLGKLGAAMEPALTAPLPTAEPRGLGDAVDLFRLGWRLRRMGAADAHEALRFLPMNVADVLNERLSGETLKAALATEALRAAWLGPRSPGSAFGLAHHRPAWRHGLLAPPVWAAGGPGSLTTALAAAASAAGTTIRTEALVTRVLVDASGVRGVVVNDDEEIEAKVVASSLDPRRSLLTLPEPGWLDPEFVHAVRGIRGRGTVAVARVALDAVPEFPGMSESPSRVIFGPSLDVLERSFDANKYGRMPEELSIDAYLPSADDDTLAPAGSHVMLLWVQFVPHALRDGTWDQQRARLWDTIAATIERSSPGFTSRVKHYDLSTPPDLERQFGVTEGCLYHAELALDQVLYMRPVPGWYGYRMPIRGLYLCGSGTHGGGGVTGLAGKNAATQMLSDLADGVH